MNLPHHLQPVIPRLQRLQKVINCPPRREKSLHPLAIHRTTKSQQVSTILFGPTTKHYIHCTNPCSDSQFLFNHFFYLTANLCTTSASDNSHLVCLPHHVIMFAKRTCVLPGSALGSQMCCPAICFKVTNRLQVSWTVQ